MRSDKGLPTCFEFFQSFVGSNGRPEGYPRKCLYCEVEPINDKYDDCDDTKFIELYGQRRDYWRCVSIFDQTVQVMHNLTKEKSRYLSFRYYITKKEQVTSLLISCSNLKSGPWQAR